MKILSISDDGVATGYGRIAMNVNLRLAQRGYTIHAASFAYDGLLPAQYEGVPLPYHVASLQGKPNWVEECVKLIGALQPDLILVAQDFPYSEALRNAPIDWSVFPMVIITPVDGAPIFPRWVEVMKAADAGLTISQFGVDTFKDQGVQVGLCRPGVDSAKFYPIPHAHRLELRARLGIDPKAFVLGTMAMNQGRKCITHMMEGFFEFAKDKPTARYVMDMEPISPAGWDLVELCKVRGWDANKLIFRHQCMQAGVVELRERYNLLDAHAVLSHREGYGLPLAEAQACGVVSMALDYCSGPEICGNGRGVLVKALDYKSVSTWGNALDYHPDVADFTAQLQRLHDEPVERGLIARRGMAWSVQQTWDKAAANVIGVIEQVLTERAALKAQLQAVMQPQPTAPAMASPDGVAKAVVPV